jgi:protein-L-isoaspartate(D-aspartate) O-methyltransferase
MNSSDETNYLSRRLSMVDSQIHRRGVRDAAVLAAIRSVPRHLFVPKEYRNAAYGDGPLPIGEDQTISQPYVVASMTEELEIDSESRVLEVGTGSGYQCAVLAEIAREVYTIEVIPSLQERAEKVLRQLDYANVRFRISDGADGWPEASPFDGIIVTAAASEIPPTLIAQLRIGGRMVIPVQTGRFGGQDLVVVTRTEDGIKQETLYPVRFVPLQGY